MGRRLLAWRSSNPMRYESNGAASDVKPRGVRLARRPGDAAARSRSDSGKPLRVAFGLVALSAMLHHPPAGIECDRYAESPDADG
jgi:hypothetical protein